MCVDIYVYMCAYASDIYTLYLSNIQKDLFLLNC